MTTYTFDITAYSETGKQASGTFSFDFDDTLAEKLNTGDKTVRLEDQIITYFNYTNEFYGKFEVPEITGEDSIVTQGALFSSIAGPAVTWVFSNVGGTSQIGFQYFSNNSTGNPVSGGILWRPDGPSGNTEYWYFMASPQTSC